MSIQILPPKVAASIAAGEVVERPASVAKELVENAIDAGATVIRVEIERGGLDLIRVSDDGCGIDASELEVACQRHATSKLTSADDLANLTTLGFRGEALPSIVAAGDVQLASRTAGGGPGSAVRFRGGRLDERLPFGGARGTAVTVKNLFANHPARLKFLRSAASEAGQVASAVQPYAVAYPGIRFSLSVDGRQVLQTTGSGDLRDAAARVLGANTATVLLDIEDVAAKHDSGIRVTGLVSPPSLNRATRSGISIFVNHRWVQPRRLTVAVEQAYDTLLMSGRHPVAMVMIDLPPSDVDVNVHPTKAEVRFLDERAVFGAIMKSVRQTLVGFAPVPSFDPAERLFSRGPYRDAMLQSAAVAAAGGAPVIFGEMEPSQAPLWQSLLRPSEHDGSAPRIPADAPRMPLLRVVGQTGGTYVVAEGPTGMYLIDQHAAHERVLYERINAQRQTSGIEVQGLLTPVSLELSPQQAAAYAGYRLMLAEQGFDVEPFGERTLLVRSVPAVLAQHDVGRMLQAMLEVLADERETPTDDRLVKTLACHGSVRAGKAMAMEEMRELVLLLEGCEAPRTCPHGRPTMVHLSTASLEREFHRR